jgi:uncharacterized protein YdeI (YjbR/CyaY-like superfamily)
MVAKKKTTTSKTARPDSFGDVPILSLTGPAPWAKWLEKNQDASKGVWLRFGKKTAGKAPAFVHAHALEVALAYGWIDGQARGESETTYLQKFTPRGKRSIWSKINRAKAEAMIADGRMKPRGAAEVERARQDGRWEAAYDSPRNIGVPDDLQAALDANPKARAFFATLNSQNRYAILFRTHTAKRPETRAKRIAQFVEMLAREEKIYP